MGNPRVYKALKEQMQEILIQLKRLDSDASVDDDLKEAISQVCIVLNGLKQE